jgi:hypothetical protein
MSAAPVPLPPFDAWPVQLVFGEREGLLWLADDGTICVQMLCERGDLGVAKRYVGAVRAIRAMRPLQTTPVRMIQDFQRLRTVEKSARAYLSDAAGRDFRAEDLGFNKVRVAEELVLVRIALYLHSVALSQLGLPHFESVRDLGAELGRLGIAPPRPDPNIGEFRREFAETCARLQDP